MRDKDPICVRAVGEGGVIGFSRRLFIVCFSVLGCVQRARNFSFRVGVRCPLVDYRGLGGSCVNEGLKYQELGRVGCGCFSSGTLEV